MADDVLTVNQGRSPRFDSAAFAFYYSVMILFGADWRNSQNRNVPYPKRRKMDIFRFLEGNGIAYERCDHPAVFTCEEADRLVPPMEGTKTKNLFVRDKKGRRHFLVVVGYEKTVDLKSLSSLMGLSSLAMASPDRLRRYLGVDPGSVTILAVINDTEKKVEVLFDRALWHSQSFLCHPLINTSTLAISKQGIQRFLELTGHEVIVQDVPASGRERC
jgi:Ala-tRNA(Pro) deacylase